MRLFKILIIILSFSKWSISQNSIGIEIRTSSNITFNSSEIRGGGNGFSVYEVMKEGNLTTASYSIGITYSTSRKNMFKLHIGKHQNGRIIDLTEYDDTGSIRNFESVELPYNYLQFIPSYSYSIRKGKFNIPIEIGLALNKRIKEEDIFYIEISEYNYDIRISSGIQYRLNNFSIGSNLIYSKSIDSYTSEIVVGEFKPNQIGIELGIGYTINLEKENTITNIR